MRTKLSHSSFLFLTKTKQSLVLLSLILFFLSVLVFSSSALAATFTVNSTTDAVDVNPGNGVCASAGGFCTLRAAIMETNALAGMDTIILPAGTYIFNIAGSDEDAGATGDLDITQDLTIDGAGSATTIIDGNNLDRVFDIQSGSVTISGVTIQNGNSGSGDNGGAILVLNNTNLTISSSLIRNNNAGSGGGIYYFGSGTLSVINTTITGNSANAGTGGLFFSFGTALLDNVNISGNTAIYSGGGISNSSGTMTINNSIVRSNSSEDGGGIFSSDTLILNNCELSENSASFYGGGIYNQGNLTIMNSSVKNNSAVIDGGGIMNQGNTGSMVLNNTTISGNTAAQGGGIFNNINPLTINNSTISGNMAANGGGLAINSGMVALNYVTIYDNSSTNLGGGIFNNFLGTITLRNTIVAGSHISTNCSGTITSLGHNLDSSNSCSLNGIGDIINTDPLLSPLQINYPGSTATHALLAGSPAIDAADPTTFPSTDQRGITRPQGVAPDIGAYELASAVSVPALTEWGMIFFMVIAAIGSVHFLRRYKRNKGDDPT